MKVLIVHTYYIARGGEDLVFETESKFLSEAGIDVSTLKFNNAHRTILSFILYPFNLISFFRIIRYLGKHKPDVVHIHNWHFAASPSVIAGCKLMKVPIVQTLHNHRLINHLDIKPPYSKGISPVFKTEKKKKIIFSLTLIQNLWVQICCNIYKTSGIWKWVDRYIVLTDSSKELYLKSHFKLVSEKFRVKSNFIDGNEIKQNNKKDFFLFVGRLTYEKGAHILLSAFEESNLKLKIIGDGPLKKEVEQLIKTNPNIEYLGFRDFNYIKEVMSESLATIFPSITLEGMPMTIIESFACGTPVIASKYSAMQNMIKEGYNGFHFEIGNVGSLKQVLADFSKKSPEEIMAFSDNARQSYKNRYNPEVNINKLISTYKEIVKEKIPSVKVKVLLIHTNYNQKGGEDAVFLQENILLNETEEVNVLTFQNKPSWQGGMQFFLSIWNLFVVRKIKKNIQQFKPDVIHIHNWHFAIGPIVIRVAKKAGIPVVLTLHNYRLLCPSATLLSEGKLFTDSINASFPWKAIRNKVYRDSVSQTFWAALVVWLHKKTGTWNMVNKYIVLTDFAKDLFVHSSLGIPESRFIVKPNFVVRSEIQIEVREDHFLFVGRLTEDKGINLLLDVFTQSNYKLRIAGDGPLKPLVERACNQYKNIKYIGNLDRKGVENEMRKCTALIFPSLWYEGMPMTIIEAFSLGLTVIASNLGAMSAIIEDGFNGLHFETGNAISMSEKISYWANLNEIEKSNYSKNAVSTFKSHYTNKRNKELLLGIYRNVINEKKS